MEIAIAIFLYLIRCLLFLYYLAMSCSAFIIENLFIGR